MEKYVHVLVDTYILYDTNNILLKTSGNGGDDCIRGGLDYYMDILNLFSEYLEMGQKHFPLGEILCCCGGFSTSHFITPQQRYKL